MCVAAQAAGELRTPQRKRQPPPSGTARQQALRLPALIVCAAPRAAQTRPPTRPVLRRISRRSIVGHKDKENWNRRPLAGAHRAFRPVARTTSAASPCSAGAVATLSPLAAADAQWSSLLRITRENGPIAGSLMYLHSTPV